MAAMPTKNNAMRPTLPQYSRLAESSFKVPHTDGGALIAASRGSVSTIALPETASLDSGRNKTTARNVRIDQPHNKMKIERHPNTAPMLPPMLGAAMMTMGRKAVKSVMALTRSWTPAIVSRAIAVGRIEQPWPRPMIARPAINTRTSSACAQMPEPPMNSSSATIKTLRRPYLSDSVPQPELEKALKTQLICSVSVARTRRHPKSRCICGMFGMYASVAKGPIMSMLTRMGH
mmetsp:Transcript_6784/g.21917  ORF Transcript_6784/g.21917 Transcript_6784/m.21917 type:complete len:233 (-) Transcript_6784:136-834(-)